LSGKFSLFRAENLTFHYGNKKIEIPTVIETFLSFAFNSGKPQQIKMKLPTSSYNYISAGLFLVAILIVSCGRNSVYDRSVEISEIGWHEDTIAVFDDVIITDTILPFNFYINIRHSDNYRFSNFFLFLNTTLPNGKTSRDTIELVLADPSGKWFGNGFGHIKDNRVLVRENLVFPYKGNYNFTIEQAMREDDEVLEGVKSVGIRIENEE
jgi:gliding motility-associated lipoprotein GldH